MPAAHGMKRTTDYNLKRESKKHTNNSKSFLEDLLNDRINTAGKQEIKDILQNVLNTNLCLGSSSLADLENCKESLLDTITELENEIDECDTDLDFHPKKNRTPEQVINQQTAPLARKLEITKQLFAAQANLGLMQIASLRI